MQSQGGIDVVTLGETLVALRSHTVGPLRSRSLLEISVAGAESNVAIGLSRLGHRATWVGRVGADYLGEVVLAQLRAEDVQVHAHVDQETQTSLMLKVRRTADVHQVVYYRRGLAGSRLSQADIDADIIRRAQLLHITGITPALSHQASNAVVKAVELARESGTAISLDVNYRSSLWSPEEAGTALRPLALMADLVFASVRELELLERGASEDPLTAARNLAASRRGRQVVVKQSSNGAFVVMDGAVTTCDGFRVRVVDPVGAGDAFVAGYLSALLDGLPLPARLQRGCETGAFVVSTDGDWEGFPRRAELGLLALDEESTVR